MAPPPGVSSANTWPAHRLGEPAGDREAEADAGTRGRRVVAALERGEHVVGVLGRDARAAVDDPQFDESGVRAAGDGDAGVAGE